MTELADLLACPRCDGALSATRCRACRISYPVHGGIPWLFADPGAAVSDWKLRWQLAIEQGHADLQRVRQRLQTLPPRRALQTAISPPTAPPAEPCPTRRRLETLAHGYQRQQDCLQHILEPLELARGTSLETLLALRTRLPPAQTLFGYEANAHRDWCWGEAECRVSAQAVDAALADHRPQRVLVLGAGAGRLAYDLHQAGAAERTVALDLNPLLAYTGMRVCAGEQLELVEFPLAPRHPECAAVLRRLRAPNPSRAGLEFVLADAARPPFQPASFDLVVTPWLLDVMDAPVAETLARVNRLLRPGGLWVHHGSVAFDGPDPAERMTLPELEALAAELGFGELAAQEQTTAYLCSPDSRHGRTELVTTLRGRKLDTAPAPPRHQSLPDWIVTGRSPVPDLPAFRTQAMTTRMHAFLMTLIDGQRSLQDMARLLEQQQLMPRRDAETALRGFLVKMYDEARRAGCPPL